MSEWKRCRRKEPEYQVREPLQQSDINGAGMGEWIQTINGVWGAIFGEDLVLKKDTDTCETIIPKITFEKNYKLVRQSPRKEIDKSNINKVSTQ